MSANEELQSAIIEGKMDESNEITQRALDEGLEPTYLMNEVLIPAMEVVGEKFENQEYFVPEVLVSARSMQASLDLIRPLLRAQGIEGSARVAVGTVKGDIHEIGKNILCMVLEGAGFDVLNLGVDISPQDFVDTAQKGAQVIGMSSLLTTARHNMEETIKALEESGLREKVKVIVGGAAVTPEYAEKVSADAFAKDANEAVRVIKGLLG